MTRWIVGFFSLLVFVAPLTGRAQVAESATTHGSHLYVGGEGSIFQPDYAGTEVAKASPQHLYGIGAYADDEFTRWIQIEAEARWMRWNQYKGINENTYMIGPRVPIIEYKRFKPYGKFLIGFGNGSFLTGGATAIAFGGGLDYTLSRKLTLRAIDFEYQDWRVGTNLIPFGESVGLSYRIF